MSSEVGLWSATWSHSIPWMVPSAPLTLSHTAYLENARNVRLEVDPYLLRQCRTHDIDQSSWQGFHPELSQDLVVDFARATHNDIALVSVPLDINARFVLYRLFVFRNTQDYTWEAVLQAIVENGGLPTMIRITKTKKRKGTSTQATALLMMSATTLDCDYMELSTYYSRMFGIMRRSYKAKSHYSGNQTAPTGSLRRLTMMESISEPFVSRIAIFIGQLHRKQGFHTVPGRLQVELVYYKEARQRMIMSCLYSDAFTEVARQMASRASVRLESVIRRLLETESRCLPTVYNFFGEREDESGTILVDDADNIAELNPDDLSGRRQEPHDNIAVLARWTHLTHFLSTDTDDVAQSKIMQWTLVPYYRSFLRRPPNENEIRRFWTFVELEYLEYWFYFLQVAHILGLCRMTSALRNLERILGRLPAEMHLAGSAVVPSILPMEGEYSEDMHTARLEAMQEQSFWIRP